MSASGIAPACDSSLRPRRRLQPDASQIGIAQDSSYSGRQGGRVAGTSNALFSPTISGTPPTLVATTGTPDAIASSKRSASLRYAMTGQKRPPLHKTAARLHLSGEDDASAIPGARAAAVSVSRSGPSPTITSVQLKSGFAAPIL
jgi:hypothetical protein